jgi:hypothetical protein
MTRALFSLVATTLVLAAGPLQAQPGLTPITRAAPTPAAPGLQPTLRRFAIIASANDGGAGRAKLRYADSDARAVADVLQSLGGLSAADLALVPSASRAKLQASFARLKESVRTAGRVRRELFVYYSGHSDEEGLLLGEERVPYKELRSWIDDAGADVRIAILDSCASGALIALKGGRQAPPFLADLSTDARGHAFLTASSANEAAQESERIGAAFFTHYLLSGLRGAADVTRDGRVTLNEAYKFAYDETLRRTERTAAGPQHPNYDIQLAGTNDFPMTDVRAGGASLVLDDKIAGRVYVRDRNGRLLVELRKEPLYPVELGLGPGEYLISLDADGRPFEAKVTLSDGGRARLDSKEFHPVAGTIAMARGDRPQGPVASPYPVIGDTAAPYDGPYRHIPFEPVLVPGVRPSGNGGPVLNNFVLGVVGHSHALEGVQLSLGGNVVDHYMQGAQLSAGFNLTNGPARGLQSTSGANIARSTFQGAQFSGGVNVAMGAFKGIQAAPLNVASSSFQGAQLGVANWSGDFKGIKLGVAHYTNGNFRGFDASVASFTKGEHEGPQLGVLNGASSMRGPQIGVVNMGRLVDGLQIGVLNLSGKSRGLQLGVLNIAESVDGASVGLINLIGDGYHPVTIWGGDILPLNVGVKLGSRYVYTLLGFGTKSGSKDKDGKERALYGASAGLGVHAPLPGQFFLDVDVVSTQFMQENDWDQDNQAMGSFRVNLGFQLFKHLAITAGPTYNVYVHKNDTVDHSPGWGVLESTHKGTTWSVRRFPGLQLGLQI